MNNIILTPFRRKASGILKCQLSLFWLHFYGIHNLLLLLLLFQYVYGLCQMQSNKLLNLIHIGTSSYTETTAFLWNAAHYLAPVVFSIRVCWDFLKDVFNVFGAEACAEQLSNRNTEIFELDVVCTTQTQTHTHTHTHTLEQLTRLYKQIYAVSRKK